MRVKVHFYDYQSVQPTDLLWHARLRAWATSLFGKYIHVNYQIGPWIYDLNTTGYDLYQERYRVTPAETIEIEVDDEKARAFIDRFAGLYGERLPPWTWLSYVMGVFFCAHFTNCSLFAWELTDGGEPTPDRLCERLRQVQRPATLADDR